MFSLGLRGWSSFRIWGLGEAKYTKPFKAKQRSRPPSSPPWAVSHPYCLASHIWVWMNRLEFGWAWYYKHIRAPEGLLVLL